MAAWNAILSVNNKNFLHKVNKVKNTGKTWKSKRVPDS